MTPAKSPARARPRARRAGKPEKAKKSARPWDGLLAPALIFVYTLVAAIVALFAHRTPGYGVETDLLTDFAPAARSLLEGRLEAPLYQFHGFGYPLLLAMFSIPAGGDFFLAGKLLNLVSAAACLWLAYALFRRYGGQRMGSFVMLGLAVNSVFWIYTVDAGTDMPSLALLLAATFGALAGRSPRALALAGAAAGFAYVTRYNALAVLLASAAVIAWRRQPGRLAAYLGGAAIPAGAWLVANAVMTGNPFFNRNYLNVAIAAYGTQTQWDQFAATVGRQFHSMADVILYDPVAFARSIFLTQLCTHWLHDAKDLLPLWLGIPGVAGVLLVWGARPGWRALALHFALSYFALGFVFYNVRFMLYLLPFYLAGAAALLFPGRPERGNRVREGLARSPLSRRPALSAALAAVLLLLSARRAQVDMRTEIAHEPKDVRMAGDALRQLGPRNGIVMTRKPHVAFYAGMRQLRFPADGTLRDVIKEAHRGKADYVLYSGMEASLRPDILVLMEPDVQLPGFHQIDRQEVDPANYYALYKVDPELADSAVLDSAIVSLMQRFLANHEHDAAVHYDVGKELLDMGRTKEAVAELDTAHALQPNLLRAWMIKAEAHRRLGSYDAARDDAARARALGAPEPWKEADLGKTDLAQGRTGDARAHFLQSLRLEPTNVETLELLEKTQLKLGDATGAAATRSRLATLAGSAP
jgi:tetratricopeptide (TPR) repeat protein